MSGCPLPSPSAGRAPPSSASISTTRAFRSSSPVATARARSSGRSRPPVAALHVDPAEVAAADFFIVTVPTPIDQARRPDLTALLRASKTVGAALKKGDIVVYESTVYPGATEEDCVPILEQASGLAAGRDFTVGYSPERINPGDKAHRFETIEKVVAGQDARDARDHRRGLRVRGRRRACTGRRRSRSRKPRR